MLKHLPCSRSPGVRVKLSLPSEANRPLVPSWICSRTSDSSALLSSLVSSWLWLHFPLKTLGLVTLQGEMCEGLFCSCFLLLKGHSPAYPQAQGFFFFFFVSAQGRKEQREGESSCGEMLSAHGLSRASSSRCDMYWIPVSNGESRHSKQFV